MFSFCGKSQDLQRILFLQNPLLPIIYIILLYIERVIFTIYQQYKPTDNFCYSLVSSNFPSSESFAELSSFCLIWVSFILFSVPSLFKFVFFAFCFSL